MNIDEWLQKNGFDKTGEFISKPQNASGIGVKFYDPEFASSDTDWIYAMRLNDEIKYIGETAQTLSRRMRLYYLEAREDSTNAGMRERLKKLLRDGQTVEIYAQRAPSITYRNRTLKLRVDLEISMIKEVRPEWNKKGLYT